LIIFVSFKLPTTRWMHVVNREMTLLYPLDLGLAAGTCFHGRNGLTAPHRQFRPFGVGDSKQTFIVRLQDLLKVATMTKIRF